MLHSRVMPAIERDGTDSLNELVTMSGFDADNPLRRLGDVNLYLASHEYGFVEIGHAALCHAVLDLSTAGNG